MKTLQEAMDFIAQRYTFTEESYPGLNTLSQEQQLLFALHHNLLHMNKSIGKMATCLEACEHGKELNQELLKEAIVKQFINTLRTAELIGLSAEDLFEDVPKRIL